MNKELEEIINKASFQVLENNERLLLRSKFMFFNKSNFGVLLFLFMGISLVIISITKGNDWLTIILAKTLGSGIFILSTLTIIKQFTDFVMITNEDIEFRHNLKRRKFTLDLEMKIKMKSKTEFIKASTNAFSGSYFRKIDLILLTEKSEYKIFNFHVDEKYSREANRLSNDLLYKIKQRIKASSTNT